MLQLTLLLLPLLVVVGGGGGGDILAHSGRLMLAASPLDTASSAQLEQFDTLPTDFQLDVKSSLSPLLLLVLPAASTGPFALAPFSEEDCRLVGVHVDDFSLSPLLAAAGRRTMVAEP